MNDTSLSRKLSVKHRSLTSPSENTPLPAPIMLILTDFPIVVTPFPSSVRPGARAPQRDGNLQNGSAAIRAAVALLLCSAQPHTDTADESSTLTAGWRRRQPHRVAQSAPPVRLDRRPGVDEDVDSAWAPPTAGLRCTGVVVA